MQLFLGNVIAAGLSFGEIMMLISRGCSGLSNTVAKSPNEPSVNPAVLVLLTVLLALYICGLVFVWRTLIREKRERLKPLPEADVTTRTGVSSAPENEESRRVCCELEAFPPIDNKLIAEEMRRRILAAVSLKPTDPQVLARLNVCIEKLNAATKRRFLFPGISTVDKHGCAMPIFLVFSILIVTLNLISHGCSPILIPAILIAVYSGLIAAAKTPSYLQGTMNTSFLFRLITGIHTGSGTNLREAWRKAQKPELIEVTFYDGRKAYFLRRRNWIVMMSIAAMISLLAVVLSTYILIPLTGYYIFRNYLLVSANTVDYSTPAFSAIETKVKLRKIIKVLLTAMVAIVFFVTGFSLQAAIGTFFVLSPMLFIPEGYLSYFNSHASVAITYPEPERSRRLGLIEVRCKKYFCIVIVAVFCWMACTSWVIVGSTRFYEAQEKNKKEKVAAKQAEEHRRAEEERKKRQEEKAEERRLAEEERKKRQEEKAEERRLAREEVKKKQEAEKKRIQEQRRQRREKRSTSAGKASRWPKKENQPQE